jgi:hypothetical protein
VGADAPQLIKVMALLGFFVSGSKTDADLLTVGFLRWKGKRASICLWEKEAKMSGNLGLPL